MRIWLRTWVWQTALLIGVYFCVMVVLTFWMPAWHDLDVKFFNRASAARALSPLSDITLVDDRSVDVPADRRRMLAAFLERLASSPQRPTTVILDYNFDPCQSTPCGEPLSSTNAALIKALESAAQAGIHVFATEIVPVNQADDVIGPLSPRDPAIYSHLTGAAHNNFNITADHFVDYRACYAPKNGLSIDVWAMALRALPEFDRVSRNGCDSSHHAVPGGASLPHLMPAYTITNSNPFPSRATFDKYVVVGTLQYDRPANSDISGPELVTRALDDALQQVSPNYIVNRPQDTRLLLLVPGFSGLTVIAFVASFLLGRRLPLRSARRFLPWLAAGAAFCAGIAAFAGFEYLMLLSGQMQPQVTLVSLGVLVSAFLSGVRGRQFMQEEMQSIEASGVDAYDYDVFVSYAHEDGSWVYEHVYLPLARATLLDGRKLNIFYDRSSIGVGAAWQDKIALAIEGSRFIVPVYSKIYFTKKYCNFEIKRALRKWIEAGSDTNSDSTCVLPIMLGHPAIPSTVDDIQAISIDDDPAIVEKIVALVVGRLSQSAGGVAT